MIKDKSQIKAKCIIDHLELRSLDASKIADELLMHYNKKKDLMYKSLIIAMIMVWMSKWNKKIGNVTKNILAAQSDTTLTTILLHSLNNHRNYGQIIILTFECLKAYIETWKAYKQGIFQEDEMIKILLSFKNSTKEVQVHRNDALYSLIMFWSLETINEKIDDLVNHAFNIWDEYKNILEQSINEDDLLNKQSDLSLAVSGIRILQAISCRQEESPIETKDLLTRVFQYFDSSHWESSKYAINLFNYITIKEKTEDEESSILPNTINKIISIIYQRISSEGGQVIESADKQRAIENLDVEGEPLNHSINSYNQQLISMWKVLNKLYIIRGDSLALNHSNEITFDVYRKLCDLQPILNEGEVSKEEDDISVNLDELSSDESLLGNIQAAFHSYIDNLVFKYSVNRYKVAQNLIRYGKSISVFDEITANDTTQSARYRISGAWNYLQLIQLAVSIMYISSTTLNIKAELQSQNGLMSILNNADFDSLLNPIKSAIKDGYALNKRMTNLTLGCVAKMLKYLQVFSPNDNALFISQLNALLEVSNTNSKLVTIIFSVFVQLSASNAKSPIGNMIPSFLKSFDSEVEDKRFKASSIEEMFKNCADITKNQEIQELAQDQELDLDKFTEVWEEYLKSKDATDPDTIKVDFEDLTEAIENEDQANPQQSKKLLFNMIMKQIENTNSRSMENQQPLESESQVESSHFSLDEAGNDSEDQSMMGYVRNMKDHSYSLEDDRSVTLSNQNFKI